MPVILLGALLVLIGVLFLAARPIWRGWLSGRRSRSAVVAANTLEPRTPGAGIGLATNWPGPGLALVVIGAILLLLGAAL
jgi:hypothetical protein